MSHPSSGRDMNKKQIIEALFRRRAELKARLAVSEQEIAARAEVRKQAERLLSWNDAIAHSLPQKKPTGRKGTWKGPLGAELLMAVEGVKKANGAEIGTAGAIKILRGSAKWRGYEQRELETRYSEARPRGSAAEGFQATHAAVACPS